MRVALVLVLTGCHGMFGLDETVDQKFDADRDGIDDRRDNCLAHANPAQEDSDADGTGDPCDPTPDGLACYSGERTGLDTNADGIDDGCQNCALPLVDEDADGLTDQCDPCPWIANDTANADGDALTDGCDPGPTPHVHLVFDGFNGTELRDVWQTDDWVMTGDGAVATSAKPLRYAFPVEVAGAEDLSVIAAFAIPQQFEGKQVMIFAEQGGRLHTCSLVGASPNVVVRAAAPSGTVLDALSGESENALRMTIRRGTKLELECTLLDRALTTSTVSYELDPGPVTVGFAATVATELRYADIVGR